MGHAQGEHDLSTEERTALARPVRRRVDRLRQRSTMEKNLWGGAGFPPGSPLNQRREQAARGCIVPWSPTDLTWPRWSRPRTLPGKRPILATGYYPALREPNVELVPRAVARVSATGIVDSDGTERQVDVIVQATGFRAADYLARVDVTGRSGRTLAEQWARGTAGLPRHHRSRLPELLPPLRARHQWRRARVHARGAGPMRRAGDAASAPGA